MTDLDLERLGDLWRQRPTAEELESLRRSAETARRKAKRDQRLDLIVAVAVAGIVLLLVAFNPSVDIMMAGGAAILILLISQSRVRRLRREELKSLTGSTQEMLDQSVARAKAAHKRTRFQFYAVIPSFILGLGIAALVERRSDEFYGRLLDEIGLALWMTAAGLLVISALLFVFGRASRRSKEEMERLVELHSAFRSEGVANDRADTGT